MSHLVTLLPGTRGIDANAAFDAADAHATWSEGYRFVGRYIRRGNPKGNDLTVAEVRMLHAFKLAVLPIQHVERDGPPWWTPSIEKGEEYGTTAITALHELTWPPGGPVVLDLEGCMPGTDAVIVDAYCRTWLGCVKDAGFKPMLYVGEGCVLGADALFRLPVDRYFVSYNLNVDEYPATRGACLRQHKAKHDDIPAGVGFPIDVDVVQLDHLGGLPTALAPDDWSAT